MQTLESYPNVGLQHGVRSRVDYPEATKVRCSAKYAPSITVTHNGPSLARRKTQEHQPCAVDGVGIEREGTETNRVGSGTLHVR